MTRLGWDVTVVTVSHYCSHFGVGCLVVFDPYLHPDRTAQRPPLLMTTQHDIPTHHLLTTHNQHPPSSIMAAMSDDDATMATATRQPPPSSLCVLRQCAQQVFFHFFRFSSLHPHQHAMASHGHLPAPGINVNMPLHPLESTVRHAWRQGKVVSVLFLDIEGAFPNAVTDHLLHNMKK